MTFASVDSPKPARASVRTHCIQVELTAGAHHPQNDFLAVRDEKGGGHRGRTTQTARLQRGGGGYGRSLALRGTRVLLRLPRLRRRASSLAGGPEGNGRSGNCRSARIGPPER